MNQDQVVQLLTIAGETIVTTPNHPFYTGAHEWLPAGQLHPGDLVRRVDGRYGMVEASTFVYAPQPMYNLTVATAHTYFVGGEQWLVHNACVDDLLDSLPGPGAGVRVDSKQLTPEMMGELQRRTGDEFSLWRMEDGSRMLFRGQGSRGFVPEGGTRLMAHTHPGNQLSPSTLDYDAIKDLPQESSAIISETGMIFRWFKSWFE